MEKLDISILYVEDEHVLRLIYVRTLERIVSNLYVAENGLEGLRLYEEKKPDLVITDIMMPVMNGLDMIDRIRKKNRHVRFVILSAYSETQYFIDAIKMGVNSFLIKPVETKKLTDLITELSNSILLEKKVTEQRKKRREAEESLRKLNEELEKRIADRTKDLEKEIKDKIQVEKELKKLNLTLEKRVREELKKRQRQQQLLVQKSKLESIGELAAGIAHEINQPLGSISLGLDNILFKMRSGKLSDKYMQKKIDVIFEDIERTRKIINHVRIFSRDQEITLDEKVELNDVVKNALSMVMTQYKKHGIDINTHFCTSGCVMGNKFRFEQVVLNLLSNAKYAVEVKRSKIRKKNYQMVINLKTVINGNDVVLMVEDNGTGISKKDLQYIFDPFYTTKDVEEGTGLGLSISYGIVRESGGRIEVKSFSGRYTRVLVTFPLCE
ncbi:MAG: response regulator [Bacteroidales bacterium]|nr:response regulator [Bacteroidales bacterium]